MDPGTPANKWSPLDRSLDWGALHLWKDGRRDEAVCARAPQTAAAVEALPLSDLPGRTPTVFFSLLRPGTHLPAHTGVSNVRTIIHLPLIVPPGCGFRVGGETREWRVGEAFAFDDTIEHEAWNRSEQLRAILIFDVWNPYITEAERDLLRRFYRVAEASDHAGDPSVSVAD
jgi:aspartyl/asparaginyl beta-hydroxylase (cupin superfamily)